MVGCVPWSEAPSRTSADVAASAESDERAGSTKIGFACAVTNRPQRAINVFSRPASESSIGLRNGTFQPVDLVPELREHRDQERVRDQHRRQHAEGRADAELRDEVEAEEREAGHGDRDRQAGEDHCAPCGGAGLGGRVARREPFVQELSEARDDEQRVVDPDADADHRHEDRRDRVDVGQPGEDEEEDERRSDGHDRQRDRDRRRDERAEDDQQHDERGQEAEQLLDSLLDGRELGVAVELGGDARRLDRLADGVLHRDDLRCGPAVSIVSENCASA